MDISELIGRLQWLRDTSKMSTCMVKNFLKLSIIRIKI